MGSCCCGRPTTVTSVQYDPTVTVHATVGDIFFDHQHYQSYNVGGCARGLMYVKEDRFFYESMCCNKLCCKSCQCCSCCGMSCDTTDIISVEVIENQSFQIPGDHGRVRNIHLKPGLRITIKQPSSAGVTILVQMLDAHGFAAQLTRLTTSQDQSHS